MEPSSVMCFVGPVFCIDTDEGARRLRSDSTVHRGKRQLPMGTTSGQATLLELGVGSSKHHCLRPAFFQTVHALAANNEVSNTPTLAPQDLSVEVVVNLDDLVRDRAFGYRYFHLIADLLAN